MNKSIRISLRMSEDMHEKVKDEAQKQQVTVSALILKGIQQLLDSGGTVTQRLDSHDQRFALLERRISEVESRLDDHD